MPFRLFSSDCNTCLRSQKTTGLILFFVSFFMLQNTALAIDRFSADRIAMEVGTSRKGAHIARILLQWDWKAIEDSACLCDFSYIEFNVSHWKAKDSDVGLDYLTEVGIKPVIRLQRGPLSFLPSVKPFLEGAIGIHYLSKKKLNNTDFDTSTKFQFGEHLAWGFSIGKKNQFVISQRFQHLSNGNIKMPNPGINYRLIHMAYRF